MARRVVGVVLAAHPVGVAAVPGVRVGEDGSLGLVGLGEEEPVPPGRREGGVGTGERLADRNAVEDGQRADRVRVVQGQPGRDVAAPVVPDDGEALVPELMHQRQHVGRHRPFRVGAVVRGRRGLGRLPVAAQVGADDRVPGGRHQGRHAVPGGVRAGVSVEQDHRGSVAPVPDAQRDAGLDLQPLLHEAVEHEPPFPVRRTSGHRHVPRATLDQSSDAPGASAARQGRQPVGP